MTSSSGCQPECNIVWRYIPARSLETAGARTSSSYIQHIQQLTCVHALLVHTQHIQTPRTMEPPPAPRPLLLHDLATPYILLWAALMVPHRRLAAALFLPLLARSCHTLLHASSPSPPASYLAGAFAVYHALTALNLLLLRNPRTEFRRLPPPADQHRPQPQPQEGEPYPHTLFPDRAAWTLDLLASMRALHWSHNPHPTAPPLPPADALSRTVYLRRRAARLLALYAFLDTAMFTIQHLDRGFFLPPGNARSPPSPTTSSSSDSTHSPTAPTPLAPLYPAARRLLAGTLIYAVLNGAYTLLALSAVLAGALAGDCRTGWRRHWLHWWSWPDAFGHWRAGHWGGGVAGLWARGWHGLFKFLFVSPGRWAVGRAGCGGGRVAGGVRLVGPFVASAALHYGGARTLAWGRGFGGGSAGFFLWQPVGVVVEAGVARWVRGGRGWPRWVCWGAPYVWVVGWLVVTSGGFFEELRYGGMWVMQPLPVSVWRWVAGTGGAWCWGAGEGGRGWWEWDESLGGWGVRI
ncbi:hypothetical protein DFP73DRAFT_629552 [Morchella snyderi]|nr:hypothetical protein DFP73DRAFT_629552 [Morchella snyderi]